ncbi:spore maturation protein [bacterium]|nr:MAG: spore maturation protein [bacterium]
MGILAIVVLPFLIVIIPIIGLIRKVAVYEEFVEGAKEGFQIGVRIIPYLVAILVAIGMFRASGAMDFFTGLLKPGLAYIGFPVDVLPMAIMRPLTGSGSVGVLADLIANFGEDSYVVKVAATMFGSTETTFYVLAVYFGAVGIKKTRYAVQAGLIADLASIIAAVIVCSWLLS